MLVSSDVPLQPRELAARGPRYPELASFLEQDWRVNGSNRDPADPAVDEAVLHVQNSAEYQDVVAVLDALHAPTRTFPGAQRGPVFAVSFAAD